MKDFYDVLVKRYNSCPPDCSLCEKTCANRNESSLGAAIQAIHIPETGFHGVIACNQCGEPSCLEICPSGAIVKSEDNGVVRILEEKCVGCGLCTLACPYGGIYFNPEMQKPFKCDTCDDNPACVDACPYGVLDFLKTRLVQSYLHDEDLLPQGARACQGCPAELALRLCLRVLGRDAILFGAPGCMLPVVLGSGTMATTGLATFPCLFTNPVSTMTGVYRYYRHIGKEVKLLGFVGDGCIADVAFQTLSGAAERGENIIIICYDNEGYMNTGIQRSSTTPFGAWTTTTPTGQMRRGKEEKSKDVPLIMVAHEIPYVATASIAYVEDYVQKLHKAMNVKDGMAYIHLFSPCPTGWRSSLDSGIEISRLAVETNYFPLWEAEHGKLQLTHEIPNPKPIHELTKLMGKFSHLVPKELEQLQELVNARSAKIKTLASCL